MEKREYNAKNHILQDFSQTCLICDFLWKGFSEKNQHIQSNEWFGRRKWRLVLILFCLQEEENIEQREKKKEEKDKEQEKEEEHGSKAEEKTGEVEKKEGGGVGFRCWNVCCVNNG